MPRFLALSFAAVLLGFPAASHANTQAMAPYTACQSDSDCVVARATCGERTAVHKDDYARLQAEWDKAAALAECAERVPETTQNMPRCMQEAHFCIMEPVETTTERPQENHPD